MQLNTSKTKEMILGPLAQANLPLLATTTDVIGRVTSFKLYLAFILIPLCLGLLMQMSVTDYCHVSFTLELIMLRAGILYTPGCEWSRVYRFTITFVISICIVFVVILLYHFLRVAYPVYEFHFK